MKKVISLVLCLMLVLSLATTAFAAEETATTYQYEIYQIFTGEFEADVLTNVMWGENGTGAQGEAVDKDTLDALDVIRAETDNETKLEVILDYFNAESTAHKTLDTNDNPATLTGLADGYYLVKDKANSQNGENDYYTTYIVQVVDGTLSINRKGNVPSSDKKIVEGEQKVDKNDASIGDTINYEITGTLPTNIADYDTYYYVFNDTLSKGLTYTNQVKVTVNGVDVTDYFYINASEYNEETGTTITVGIQDLLALELIVDVDSETEGNQTVGDITASTTVVVTYTAELNENAVIGGEGNPNDVYLDYSNDPNTDGDGATTPPPEEPDKPTPTTPIGKTPVTEVITYTTELIVKKVDEKGEILTGAAFKIEGDSINVVVTTGEVYVAYGADETVVADNCYWLLKDGTYTTQDPAGKITNAEGEKVDVDTSVYADTTTKYHKETKVTIDSSVSGVEVEGFVNENGTITFTGLGEGEYTITETVVPEGYNSIEPITVTITWSGGNSWTYTGTDVVNGTNINQVTVVNQAGSTLPETGGMGTTLFYVFGGIMALAATVLLVTKKRMSIAK